MEDTVLGIGVKSLLQKTMILYNRLVLRYMEV